MIEVYNLALCHEWQPRFKKIPFSSDSAVERMKQRIISDASAMAPQSQPTDQQQGSEDPDLATSNPVWELFEKQAVASTSRIRQSISALSELEQYFKLAVLPRKEDPLLWWKTELSCISLATKRCSCLPFNCCDVCTL